ncbi:hypothetical protein Q7C36_001882 [Tachysurus vachellii]|uniref:Uncharacterized protein n=1 Tax=Tachysurus vachellii TaxID=175792 RepID=A0AA88NTM3_TACVA|nr:hypothetical protein Q7C36_001882 [Tachysurus vachellii]
MSVEGKKHGLDKTQAILRRPESIPQSARTPAESSQHAGGIQTRSHSESLHRVRNQQSFRPAHKELLKPSYQQDDCRLIRLLRQCSVMEKFLNQSSY